MWRLARDSRGLDLNSPYTYLMLSRFFSGTCAIARDGDTPVGFIAGFRLPAEPEAIFVWQITVAPDVRARRLGRRMLAWLLGEVAGDGVSCLAASVTPSNEPSQRMFKGMARQLGAPCEEAPFFPIGAFPEEQTHEAEILLRIGPFDRDSVAEAACSLEASATRES